MLAMLVVATTHGLMRHTRAARHEGNGPVARTSSMVQTSALGTVINKQGRNEVWKNATICAVLTVRIRAASNIARLYLCSELTGPQQEPVGLVPRWQQPWQRGGAQNLEGKVRPFTAPSWAQVYCGFAFIPGTGLKLSADICTKLLVGVIIITDLITLLSIYLPGNLNQT